MHLHICSAVPVAAALCGCNDQTVIDPVSRMSCEDEPTYTANAPWVTEYCLATRSQFDTSRSDKVYETTDAAASGRGVPDEACIVDTGAHVFWNARSTFTGTAGSDFASGYPM